MRSIIPLHDDTVIDFYKELSTALKPHGMKMLQQIYHPGSARAPGKGTTQISASPIPNPIAGGIPIEMTPSMIEEMVQAFAVLHGDAEMAVLTESTFMHPVDTSLNNSYRQRTIYARRIGGSLENRMRFLMEIIHAIRQEVGTISA
ncbi:MAG: hypothetical protein CM15mP49_07260 [Actinomycetota bacterium]|nr:MAG: hypothetical protein CM15mP49_07260 [Actinomycetota bacterium]